MAREPGRDDIYVRGEQREHLDADLMAQIVIMMGRQLAREARGEAADDETLPVRKPEKTTGDDAPETNE